MPETDPLRIGRRGRERVTEVAWDEVRVDAEIADRHVTIVEARAPWDGQGEWTRLPIARLGYTASTACGASTGRPQPDVRRT